MKHLALEHNKHCSIVLWHVEFDSPSHFLKNFKSLNAIAAKRKFMKLRSEANELVVKNIQLKGTVSRLQRQEYRYVLGCSFQWPGVSIESNAMRDHCLQQCRFE